MTVCIAATYRHDFRKRGFVICTDGRLDGDEWGHADTGIKVHCVGHNCFALMSGHWHTVRDLCAAIEEDQRQLFVHKTPEDLLSRIRKSMNAFSASILCSGRVEILVTGFVDHVPIMIRGELEPGKWSANTTHDLDAIGEGSFASLMMLRHRAYDPVNISMEHALYTVYEAKRFSESVSSVGPKTRLTLHWPMPHPGFQSSVNHLEADDYHYRDLNDAGIAQLEEWRQRFFIQRVGEDLKFKGIFIDSGG